MSKKIVIFGATSAIAHACARIWAKDKASFVLVARSEEKLQANASDLKARGAKEVITIAADLSSAEEMPQLVASTESQFGGQSDIVLIAHGILGDQKKAEQELGHTLEILNTNTLSTIGLLTHLANSFERKKKGAIAVISSVAADRGRKSNYVYGASKACLDVFLEGLRHRLVPKGISVLTVKPGFTSTPMTAHLPQGPLFVKPELVAKDIIKGINRKRFEIYTPFFWWGIMAIIRSIPRLLFYRTNI